MFQTILQAYGLNPASHQVIPFGSGLINRTWKVNGADQSYILQRINSDVFTKPFDIADNLELLASYFGKSHPSYLFAAPLATKDGKYLLELDNGYFRLLPFIAGSHTFDFLTESEQAYEAANQFGQFTRLLEGFETHLLKHTLPNFHNLTYRINQFKQALGNASAQRKALAAYQIAQIQDLYSIADLYEQIYADPTIPLRVIHHDTKISNVLFDDDNLGLAVIDLDTVMPGYFISDVGDMMRTYLSEANEEEQDLEKINIRMDFFSAIYAGYMNQMSGSLTPAEKELFIYSGKFIIYMQTVRFLTDFLNGDIYYPVKYDGHNLMRAKNQLRLLELYTIAEPQFKQIIQSINTP